MHTQNVYGKQIGPSSRHARHARAEDGHLHGYAIAQLIQQLSEDVLQVEEGSLYPALQRLELNGWIEGEWALSANNRRARFYRLTPGGRKKLVAETRRYQQVTGAIARVMGMA
jgi:PadR family transcriptional regulator PadR